MKERIVQCFNRAAETYDSAAFVQTKIAKRLMQYLPEDSAQKILEIGCGTGLYSEMLLSYYPQSNLVLTDMSPNMIDVCKHRYRGLSRINVECVDGEDITHLGLFDVITSSMAMHWFNDVENSIKKITAKLTKGGRLVFAMLGENSLKEWRKICKDHGLSIPTPLFPSCQNLQASFPELETTVEVLKQRYDSLYDFLSSLKSLGATATQKNHSLFAAKHLRHILKKYDSEIDISYEVIYGHFVK